MILNQPLQLAHGDVPNRIAKAALSERLALPDGAPSRELIRLYEQWAKGGAGLLLTGNVMIDRRALGELGNVAVEDERHLAELSLWARTMKQGGARAFMQINHPGRQSPFILSKRPVAPSAVPMRGMGGLFRTPRALAEQEIEEIIQRFANTAAIAEKAGFDGVQIHGAHGYLISQFLSPLTNLRDDGFGGDAERRSRFLRLVLAATRARVSQRFTVGLKLNSADFQRGGFSQEESMALVGSLDGIDFLEISGGTYEAAVMFEERNKRDSTKRREAFFLEYAERVRAVTAIPLMVTGGFRTRQGMNDALSDGATDLIGLGRPLAIEPDLPRRLLQGESEAAIPVHLDTGISLIDKTLQGGWYQLQIERLGHGKPADPKLSRFVAVTKYLLPRRGLTAIEQAGSHSAPRTGSDTSSDQTASVH